jgi:hypothetical protein
MACPWPVPSLSGKAQVVVVVVVMVVVVLVVVVVGGAGGGGGGGGGGEGPNLTWPDRAHPTPAGPQPNKLNLALPN